MIFYTSVEKGAPNPRRVEIFLKEKGIAVETVALGLMKREHKTPEFFAKHPRGQVPALELDDGTVLTESVAICRYLEALHPAPPLFGRTALEAAQIDMWTRRIELILMSPLAQVWRHAHPFTAGLGQQFTEFGESNKPAVLDAMRWIDGQMTPGAELATADFTIADIVLLTTLQFSDFVGLAVPDECTTLVGWYKTAAARPSVQV